MSTTNTSTDTDTDTGALVALLDIIDTYPGAVALRARSIELLAAPPGSVIVDVGAAPAAPSPSLPSRAGTRWGSTWTSR
ncbi:hypothetical protein SIM91_00980 [Rhodococcus opacus]|uniref:hypothetical protein n=1 Tax=Rhodococcus opacus TaxID=37919 RepID=UPI0029C4EEF6|nr:hypothetical protein [Rhodococcus opacus]MDX5961933.1 hypothetical protein [Rhodococcus opacus]